MPIAAAAIGGIGTVASAVIGSKAASKAAKVQAKAAAAAQDTTLKMYEQQRGDLQPWRDVGQSALGSIADMYGLSEAHKGDPFSDAALEAFRKAPDYQVRMKAATEGIENADAASRSLLSGAHIRRLMEKSAEIADTSFNSYLSRLQALSGAGQNAASAQGNAAMQTGSNLANLTVQGGDAKASGIVGGANQLTDAIGGITSNLSYLALRNGSFGGGATPSLY